MQIPIKIFKYIILLIVILLLFFYLLYPTDKKAETDRPDQSSQDLSIALSNHKKNLPPKEISCVEKKRELLDSESASKNNRSEKREIVRSSQPLRKSLKGRLFIKKLEKDIPLFSDTRLAEMLKRLLHSEKTDPADFAIEFISSDNPKVKQFGLDIAEGICINRPNSFRANEFYKAYAKEGFNASKYLSRIIVGTDDDFIREWACELWSDIYYHNSDPEDTRHIKLAEYKKSEKNIYNFLKEILSDKDQLDKIIKSRGPLGDIIIKEWGSKKRMPLKMIALISIFDLMSLQNREVCTEQTRKIINTYNFNYNILGRMNNRQLDRPALPEEAVLKKLSSEVFGNRYKDTYKWLKKEDGGFTIEEMEIAVETKERQTMKKMVAVLRKIITDVLKAKLLIGLGQNEIKLLRYFNSKTWNNQPFNWNNRMLILKNRHKNSASFIITSGEKTKKSVTFLISNRSGFIWFLPQGKYQITTAPTSEIGFLPKTVDVKEQNITIDM